MSSEPTVDLTSCAVSVTLSPPDLAVCSESRRYCPIEPGHKITLYSSRVSSGPKEEMTVPEMTFVLSPHLPPPFDPCRLQILRFLRTLTPHAAVPLGFCCPIIRIILQKDGQPSSEPIHVSTQSGLRIPEQFCLQTHSGTFNVLLLGLQRKLKTFFFSPGCSYHTDKRFFFCPQTLFKEDWDAVATFANAKIRSINIWYALGRLSYLIYIFQLGHPVGLHTSLTTSSREFRLVNPPNETASPASARHRMTASSDRFNRVVTSRTYTLYLSPSQSNKETKVAVALLANIYFVVWIEFCFLDFFYYYICH